MMTEASPLKRTVLLQRLVLLGILVMAALLRLYHLGHESLWFDEAISYKRAGLPLSELVAESLKAYHNPSYFLLLRTVFWFADNEFALRLPSAIFGLAKVYLVYQLGRIALGHSGGCYAALYIALSESQIHYDQEARMYAPLLCCIAGALCGLTWLLVHLDEAAQYTPFARIRRRNGGANQALGPTVHRRSVRSAWLTLTIGSSAALYLHNTAVLFIAACSIVAAVMLVTQKRGRMNLAFTWLLSAVGIILAYLPWIQQFFVQTQALDDHGYGRRAPSFRQAWLTLREVFLMGNSSIGLSMLALALAILGVYALRKRPLLLCSLGILCVSGPGLLALVTLREPMFLSRLMLWSALPYSLLVAAGLLQLHRRALITVVVVALVMLSASNLKRGYYSKWQKPNWRGAIADLGARHHDSSLVLAIGDREIRLFLYYFGRKSAPLASFPVRFDVSAVAANVRSVVAQHRTVYTIRARECEDGRKIRTELAKMGRLTRTQKYGPKLVVEQYEMSPAIR